MTLGSSNRLWVKKKKKAQYVNLQNTFSIKKEKPDLEQCDVFKQLNEQIKSTKCRSQL